MNTSVVKLLLRGASTVALGIMTLLGVGIISSAQAGRTLGDETTSSTGSATQLACHESGHRCGPPATCGVRG
jgi:hypothetical protein